MLGVFRQAHVVEFVGTFGFADALHEFGGLLLLAFRLLACDFPGHGIDCKARSSCQIMFVKRRHVSDEVCPPIKSVKVRTDDYRSSLFTLVSGFAQMQRETGARTSDVQLGNLPSDWKYRTYASKALNPDHLEPWKIKYLRFAGSLTQ